ncbi:MAG: two-component system sensor histidine kinase NtrB, partial [Nitrospiraceae bacterium]
MTSMRVKSPATDPDITPLPYLTSTDESPAYQFILLHSLVTIVLCYQLLFSLDGLLSVGASQLVVLALLATIAGLAQLPIRLWFTRWFVGALVLGDTAITTFIIHLSGAASSNLYVTYFLIMLIAALAPNIRQMIALAGTLCAAYGTVLYLEMNQTGIVTEGHLLQIPVLLIMAVFYGTTHEAARKLFRDKESLMNLIAERQRAEDALKESEQRYKRLVEGLPDGIFITHRDRILFVNSAGFQLFGASSSEQLIGRSVLNFFHPEYDAAVVRRSLERHEPFPLTEARMIRLDGAVIAVEATASPFSEQGSPAMLMIFRNIMQRQQLEEELRQSQKMEAVGQLAGGVAHDFNNMLTIINGHCEMLLEDPTPLSADQRISVEQIGLAGKRAATLTSQLLAFSRRQVLHPKVLDLNAVVAGMDQMLRPLLGENIELLLNLSPSLGRVKADPGQLDQVIINLTVNARDAMPQGGRLTIETSNVEPDEAVSRREEGGGADRYVLLAIGDTGIGMDAKIQAHVFEPFFTTKPKGKGTGLGLSTVYGIVRQSGGFITVDSRAGEGTRFKIYLPLVDAPVDRDDRDGGEETMDGRSETVLVAEDEPAVRDLVCQT